MYLCSKLINMKKILLICLPVILLYSCDKSKKKSTTYRQYLHAYYYTETDSYSANAVFAPEPDAEAGVKLQDGESITFAGKMPDTEDNGPVNYTYKWAGSGKPEIKFTLNKDGGKSLVNYMPESYVKKTEIMVPDTIYMGEYVELPISNEQKYIMQVYFTDKDNNTLEIPAGSMTKAEVRKEILELLTPGPINIAINQHIRHKSPTTDDESYCSFQYVFQYNRQTWLAEK